MYSVYTLNAHLSYVIVITMFLPNKKIIFTCYSDEDNPPDRTPEHLESLPKNATALRGRRGAIHLRQHSVFDKKGHRFVKKFFRQPAHCSYCQELVW